MQITSASNAKVKQWMKYKEKKHRDQEQCFLIEGEHLIEEAHRCGLVKTIILALEHQNPWPMYESYEVTSEIIKKLSDSKSGSYIMALCQFPQHPITYGKRIVVLDDVQDPGNVGTMIRSALSFGYDMMLLSPQCVDVYNDKVIRSTQGALFHLPIIRGDIVSLVQELKTQGYSIYATSLHQATPLSSIQPQMPHALIFGNEGKGVSDAVLACADEKVIIEMETFESLNVAVAAAICMYEFSKHTK